MSTKKRLADVLTISKGEIKPRVEAKEVFDSVFGDVRPTLSYGQYINWCARNRRQPSREEFLRFKSFEFDDGGPGAA